jgi:hypothetical protein
MEIVMILSRGLHKLQIVSIQVWFVIPAKWIHQVCCISLEYWATLYQVQYTLTVVLHVHGYLEQLSLFPIISGAYHQTHACSRSGGSKNVYDVRFGVFTTVTAVFWDMAPCRSCCQDATVTEPTHDTDISLFNVSESLIHFAKKEALGKYDFHIIAMGCHAESSHGSEANEARNN